MKLTAIIILAACLQVSARGFGQRISITVKDAPLEKVFTEIRKQAGYNFVYANDVLQKASNVDITVKSATIEEVLSLIFQKQPLSYSIIDKVVVVKIKEPASVSLQDFSPPPPIDVHGRVVNETGEPVEGVTVTVKGTKIATATNANGEFTLKGIDEKATLVFTSTNVETYEMKVNGKSDVAAT